MRIVVDTNALVSALVFPGGSPEAVYRLAMEGTITLVTTPALLAELGRVLEGKFGWEDRLVEEAVAQILRIAMVVEPGRSVSAVEADPADNRVLEAALEGKAMGIVSGDRHLLRLKSWERIPIADPATFLAGTWRGAGTARPGEAPTARGGPSGTRRAPPRPPR